MHLPGPPQEAENEPRRKLIAAAQAIRVVLVKILWIFDSNYNSVYECPAECTADLTLLPTVTTLYRGNKINNLGTNTTFELLLVLLLLVY